MKVKNSGNLWAACSILGVALGFILSNIANLGYGVGMPIGVLLGVGTAFLLTSFAKTE